MNSTRERQAERVSLLGPMSDLKGDFVTGEELVILGRISGQRVEAPVMTIGPAAHVTADIYAKTIRIEGVVVGDIHAEISVILHASAKLRGAIHSPSITIVEGATINGGVNINARNTAAGRETRERHPRTRAARHA